MNEKLILKQSGIGDLIIFISYLHQFNKKAYIDFDRENINYWRTDPDDYYSFLLKFANFLLPNDNLIVKEKLEDGKIISIEEIFSFYKTHFTDFKFINLKDKFNFKKDPDKIVLNTKVRGLPYNHYSNIKQRFYDILNNTDKKIILLGEREIEYGKEYKLHGEKAIYSIYNDAISNINTDNIEDLTIPKLGITSLDFDNIVKDINIIGKHKNICFGSSGIVSLCSCFTDVISCIQLNEPFAQFLDNKNIHLKGMESFLNELPNFINN